MAWEIKLANLVTRLGGFSIAVLTAEPTVKYSIVYNM